jgi:hypothetical protein
MTERSDIVIPFPVGEIVQTLAADNRFLKFLRLLEKTGEPTTLSGKFTMWYSSYIKLI